MLFKIVYPLLCLNLLILCTKTLSLELTERARNQNTTITKPNERENDEQPMVEFIVTEGTNSGNITLTRSITYLYYNCICDLESEICTTGTEFFKIEKIPSDLWSSVYYYAKYSCEWVLELYLILCKRLSTNHTSSSWNGKNKKMEEPVLNFRCTNFPNQLVEVYWQENQTMTLQNFSDLTNLFQRIPIDAIKFHDAESNTEDNDCEYEWVVWLLTALVIICLPLNILKLFKCYKSPRLCKEENPTIYSFETDNPSHMPLERNLFRGLAYRTEPVQLEMSGTRY